MDLVNHVDGYDYYAFCDQDDVWKPEKIKRAITLISKEEKQHPNLPVFYNSDYHADLFVEKAEDSLRLSFRRKIHDLEVVVCEKIIPLSSSVRFEIRTDSEWYVFFADGNEIGRASIASFATEGTMYMTFTGTLLGIFAEDGDGIFVDGFGFKGE